MSAEVFTPELLAEVAALRLRGGGAGAELRGPSLHECHPWWFVEAFPPVGAPRLRKLAEATALLVRAWAGAPFGAAPSTGAEGERAEVLLRGLFGPGAAFWGHFERYLAEARAAAELERGFGEPGARAGWDLATAMQVASGRYGVARVSLAGLAELSCAPLHLGALEEVIGNVDAACAALGEVEGAERRRAAGLPCLVPALAAAEVVLSARLAAAGAALDALTRAGAASGHLSGLGFRRVIAHFEARATATFNALPAIPGRHRASAVAAAGQSFGALARVALDALLVEAPGGFREAAHTLCFPREQGFGGDREEQRGDVFARALVADVLCDAEAAGTGDGLAPLIEREARHLIGCRRRSGVGAWSYFPDFPELPPDADDLAQVLLVLGRSGHRAEAAGLVAPALRVLLEGAELAGGALETWIVPRERRSAEEELQAQWATLAWGRGADPEVMANLLFALAEHDAARFSAVIARGTAHVAACQSAAGSFPTGWYHGPFYGTWMAARLIARVAPGAPEVARATTFLTSAQRADGGFGHGPESDPLHTALALLGLAATARAGGWTAERRAVAAAARAYLGRLAAGGALARAVPFIRMELGRASGAPWQTLTYESRTLTVAFVAKAALACRDLDCDRDPPAQPATTTHGAPR